MKTIEMHGHKYQNAIVPHTCWGCGRTIEPGEKYWRCVVIVEPRVVTIKTCLPKCETVVDMIDQHPTTLADAVFFPTFPEYMAKYPDTFKQEAEL